MITSPDGDELFVIDCHHHVGSLKSSGMGWLAADGGDGDPRQVELSTRLASMEDIGLDQAVVIPGHSYLRARGIEDTRVENDAIAAYRDAMPDRFPVAVGIVEPLYGPAGLDELERIRDELGLVGVSFHNRFQGVPANSPLVVSLVQRMVELGLVPMVHAVCEVIDEALWRVQELAQAVDGHTLVVLDALSSHERSSEAIRVATLTPNLVFDTSLANFPQSALQLIDAVGPDRVLFGIDIYSNMRKRSNEVLTAIARSTSLSRQDKEKILAGNARRILGIPEPATTTGA